MNHFIPCFFTSNTEEDQGEAPAPMSDEPRVTRSQTAHLQAPDVPGPDSIPARGQRASRSPPATASDTQFFPEMATDKPAATNDVEELRRIATEAIQALALAAAYQPCPKHPKLPHFNKPNIEI